MPVQVSQADQSGVQRCPSLAGVVLTPAAGRQVSFPGVMVRNLVSERALKQKQDYVQIWPASYRSQSSVTCFKQAFCVLKEQEATFSDLRENYKLSDRVSKVPASPSAWRAVGHSVSQSLGPCN